MPALSDATASADKKRLRQSAGRLRARLQARGGGQAARAVARHGADLIADLKCGVVAAYWPFRSELDTRPLLAALDGAGVTLCLPVIPGTSRPLVFRRWRPGDALREGAYKIPVPDPQAGEVIPAALFVPLLAFDARGYRLGYGGGYYDRTLAALRGSRGAIAVGVGFAGQEVPSIPHNAYDQPMDHILCETGWRTVQVEEN